MGGPLQYDGQRPLQCKWCVV